MGMIKSCDGWFFMVPFVPTTTPNTSKWVAFMGK